MHYLLQKIKTERGNLFSIGTTSVVSIVASFIMMLAFANLLDQQALGVYQYIIATASIIGSFSFTGMGIAIVRAIGKQSYDFLILARRYLWYGSVVPISIGFIVSGYYLYKANHELSLGIFFSVIFITLTQTFIRHNSIYVAIEQFKISNYLIKAHSFAPVFFVLPVLFFMQHVEILAMLYFGGSMVTVIVTGLLLKMPQKEKGLIEQHVDKNFISKRGWDSFYLRFATHQSVINAINSSAAHLDKIVIFQMLGAQQTAIYFIAVSIPDRLRSLIKQFEPYLFSKFTKHSQESMQLSIPLKMIVMTLAITPFFLLYVSLAPILFSLLLPQYLQAVPLNIIYALTLFVSVIIIPQASLKAHASSQIFYTLSTCNIFTRLLFLFLGITWFGLQGAIIAATLTLFVYTITNYIAAMYSKK